MLKTFYSFRRAWRLLKILNSKAADGEIEKVLFAANLEATKVCKKLDDLKESTESITKIALRNFEKKTSNVSSRAERVISEIDNRASTRFNEIANNIKEDNTKLEQLLDATNTSTTRNFEKLSATTTDIFSILNSLRDFYSRQTSELNRWKDGYDYRIIKSFLSRIIISLDEIDEKIQTIKSRNTETDLTLLQELEFIRDIFISNLDGEGLVRLDPSVGEKIDPGECNYIISAAIKTDDDTKISTIAEIKKPQYSLFFADGAEKIIRKAEVKIFKK